MIASTTSEYVASDDFEDSTSESSSSGGSSSESDTEEGCKDLPAGLATIAEEDVGVSSCGMHSTDEGEGIITIIINVVRSNLFQSLNISFYLFARTAAMRGRRRLIKHVFSCIIKALNKTDTQNIHVSTYKCSIYISSTRLCCMMIAGIV